MTGASGARQRQLPDLVHGAWARRCATVGGSERFETQHVVWVQAGACYADLRVPFHPEGQVRFFAGRSGWDGDDYRWTHAIDLDPIDGDDVGRLCWEDGVLVERGMFPTPDGAVEYEEWWARLDGAEGHYLAAEAPTGCLVRVGDHCIAAIDERCTGGAFAAAYHLRQRHGWSTVASIGDSAVVPTPDAIPRQWRVVHSGASEVVGA